MSASTAKKSVKPGKPAEHPSYIEMVKAAILALKERGGSSRQAIAKYIKANYNGITDESLKTHLKLALKRGVASAKLLQPKGRGGSGSFKVAPAAKVEKKPKKKAAPKKKPAAKPKKAAPKKKPAAKKPAAKKPVAAKKAKKPAAKSPTKSPKKTAKKPVKKSPVKKSPAKKPAAKKPAAKKPAKKTGSRKPAKK